MEVVVSSQEVFERPRALQDVHTVIVKDNCGNPIFLAIQQAEDTIWAITPDDPRFADVVRELGISKRLVVKSGD